MHQQNEIAVVAKRETALLRPIATPGQLIERHKEITALIRDSLEDGKDYGIIPGTSGKNVLLKPGAERLCVAFGCHPEYKVVTSDVDHDRKNEFRKNDRKQESVGFYRFVILCELVKDGRIVGTGIGSCSTMESKYISRPRDLENTVLKMAQKRSLVAAVLNTFALSDRFTQDIEEDVPLAQPAPEASVKVYTGSVEQQKAIEEILKKNKIPEELYNTVHERMLNRPGKDLPFIIEGLTQ